MISLFGNSTSHRLSKLEQEMSGKVDRITGKGLSTNDFSNAYKAKLDSLDDEVIEPVAQTGEVITAPEGYVTPQMYGAKANGYTDDTEAIQKAIDGGKSVFFPLGEYLISQPIIIDNKKIWSLNAQDAILTYTGTGYAVRILNARNCRFHIGMIYAANGGGVEFYSDSKDSWSQYNALTFNAIFAKTDCIHVETHNEGWSNENYVFGGHMDSGKNGVNIEPHGVNGLSGWKFYNCGIEGVKNGFRLDATGVDYICNMVFANSRYGEDFDTILKTVGTVFDCKWTAPSHIMPSYIVASPETSRFVIDAPIGTYWHMHDTAYIRGCIMDGELMGERPTYETVK